MTALNDVDTGIHYARLSAWSKLICRDGYCLPRLILPIREIPSTADRHEKLQWSFANFTSKQLKPH
jgi:hypothetical protein